MALFHASASSSRVHPAPPPLSPPRRPGTAAGPLRHRADRSPLPLPLRRPSPLLSPSGTPPLPLTSSRRLPSPLPPRVVVPLADELIGIAYEETAAAAPPIPIIVARPQGQPPVEIHPALRSSAVELDPVSKRDSGVAPTTTTSSSSLTKRTQNQTQDGCSSVSTSTAAAAAEDDDDTHVLGLTIDFSAPVRRATDDNDSHKRTAAATSMMPTTTTTTTTATTTAMAAPMPFSTSTSTAMAEPPAAAMAPPGTPISMRGARAHESPSRWRRKFSLPTTSRRGSSSSTPTTTTATTTAHILGSAASLDFSPITTAIPTDTLLEPEFLERLSFSKRGSIMWRGEATAGHARRASDQGRPGSSPIPPVPEESPSIAVLSSEAELESQKVRSKYETGSALGIYDDADLAGYNIIETGEELAAGLLRPISNGSPLRGSGRTASIRSAITTRKEHELAGGMEDWEDIRGADVDRYGFINAKLTPSRPASPEPRPIQRVSTVLQLASEVPRSKRLLGPKAASTIDSTGNKLQSSIQKASARSLNTQISNASQISISRSQLRTAVNRLPGNKDRKLMDEAGDMLTLPPGLADIVENEDKGQGAEALKKKEWSRAEKWTKMAKVVKTGQDGEGMRFEFDTRSSKLIDRTWKGIPDRWRAAAWHSFLNTSAKKHKDSAPEEEIIAAFHRLLDQSSGDDMQIDIDVPRTINSHIMFRRRYRGGQRLLFRVLHSLSLYFPATGYVQGMASLAATLLCYFDEEKTFVMLVRMWTLRGLSRLYEPGFGGLMTALDELEEKWLVGGEVSKKLTEFGIGPTAFGTRWYLTLFNYSIPFPAQLRVWDVFMLLGDAEGPPTEARPFQGGLDVLHATSAALIDGTRDILLDSDFENAMKVLTSWIPIKDEELLMRVTRTEWKMHRGKRA